jgi:5-methylcytosine-specific restriction endonuclease McrA
LGRFDLNAAYNYVFPGGNGVCRFCGKVIVRGKRTSWCSDECNRHANTALSWEAARLLVIKRDKYKCQMCGTPVYLFHPCNAALYDAEARLKYPDYFRSSQGERKAEIHHIIPMTTLIDTAWEVTREIQDDGLREHWFWKLGVMLQLDTNNLITLCQKPCHDDVHNHAANEAKKEAHRLRDVPRLETYAEG